jgi:hypothetical protein
MDRLRFHFPISGRVSQEAFTRKPTSNLEL